MIFTNDQQAALQAMAGTDDQWFLLRGPAGSGKTTLAGHIAEQVLPGPVLFTAPTHAAVHVLRKSAYSGAQTMTIHSALGLRPVMNDSGDHTLIKRGPGKLQGYNSLVLDEVSMVGRELRNWIDHMIPPHMYVLLVGDPYQLPPVNQAESPYWTEVATQLHLREIVRQAADNPLIVVSQRLVKQQDQLARDKQQRRVDLTWLDDLPPYPGAGSHGVFDTTEAAMMACFRSEEFLLDPRAYRVLCYTNTQVHRYNRAIRLALRGETETPFVIGERIINRTVLGVIGDNEELVIHVPLNTEMRVLGIAPDVCELKLGGRSRFRDDEPTTLRIRSWRVSLGMVDDTGDDEFALVDAYIPMKRGVRERLLETCVANRLWLDKLRVSTAFPDLRNAYATTIHTCQGMTISNAAFIDVDDISRSRGREDMRLRLQLLYTAVTRPREALVVAPNLHDPNMAGLHR